GFADMSQAHQREAGCVDEGVFAFTMGAQPAPCHRFSMFISRRTSHPWTVDDLVDVIDRLATIEHPVDRLPGALLYLAVLWIGRRDGLPDQSRLRGAPALGLSRKNVVLRLVVIDLNSTHSISMHYHILYGRNQRGALSRRVAGPGNEVSARRLCPCGSPTGDRQASPRATRRSGR